MDVRLKKLEFLTPTGLGEGGGVTTGPNIVAEFEIEDDEGSWLSGHIRLAHPPGTYDAAVKEAYRRLKAIATEVADQIDEALSK